MTDPFDDTWDIAPTDPGYIHITNGSYDDEPEPSEPSLTPLDRIQAAVHTTTQLQAMPPANPLINGLLDLDSLALIYGPSGGSKTFLAVASGHGRDAIGIDLDPRNADLAAERVGMFLEVETSPAGGV